MNETWDKMGQSHQTVLFNQATCRIPAPRRVSPPFGQKRIDAALDPPIQPIEKQSHMCLAVEVPPTAYYRIDPVNQFLKRYGSLPPCEVSDLILEPPHRLLSRYGIQVVRVGLRPAFLRRQFVAFTPMSLT